SPWGAIKYYRLENDIGQINSDNRKLREENRELREEIEKLTTDPAYIEKIAREEHGLIRNNEIIYQFPKSGKK
ncbi:MAG: septum formation initiator family protein, partial [Thermodesulfobacteriota bacterium]